MSVSPALPSGLIKRLQTNRDGRLTTNQWKDKVLEPLSVLLWLLLPAILILGPRLFLVGRVFWFAPLLLLVILLIPIFFRAQRYARIPLSFTTLYLDEVPLRWQFWKPWRFATEDGRQILFYKRLMPHVEMQRNVRYIVYYFEEHNEYVLLSIAPARHSKAKEWYPSSAFEKRSGQINENL